MNIAGLKTVIDLNTCGTIIPTQVFGEAIAQTGRGRIVNISSIF